jgi:heme A synthase
MSFIIESTHAVATRGLFLLVVWLLGCVFRADRFIPRTCPWATDTPISAVIHNNTMLFLILYGICIFLQIYTKNPTYSHRRSKKLFRPA